MRSREEIASDVFKSAIAWDGKMRIIGNVTARELAMLAAAALDDCPACGMCAGIGSPECATCCAIVDLVRES